MIKNSNIQSEQKQVSNMTESANTEETVTGSLRRESALSSPFTLANWTVDPARNEIQSSDASSSECCIHLEPRLMKLLCYLAANQGEVLSRDELVAELWPHVIVNENSLTRAVSELRKHLSSSKNSAQAACDFIQTVPKRGYLLSVAVDIPATLPARISMHASTAFATGKSVSPNGVRIGKSNTMDTVWGFLQQPLAAASTAAALSICLTIAASFDYQDPQAVPGLLAANSMPHNQADSQTTPSLPVLQDELVNGELALFGGEISLSAAWTDSNPFSNYERPVFAEDGQRFAFIKHDVAGSSIYLGNLESEEEPAMLFQGPCEISRLTWSPLGDALLFVRETSAAPAALINAHESGLEQQQELFSLNLHTLEVSRLIEDAVQPGSENAPKSSLTFAPSAQPHTPSPHTPANSAAAPKAKLLAVADSVLSAV